MERASRQPRRHSLVTGRRRLRVLHVIQNLNYGGMERLLADIVLRVAPEEFESHVLVLQYLGRFAEGLQGRAVFHQVSSVPGISMVHPRSLIRVIRSIDPDVLHSHSGVWYKASLAAKRAAVPRVIHTEHGRQAPDPLLARLIDGLASRRTDIAVGVSQSVADTLTRNVVRGGCRVEVVLNGVDTDHFAPGTDEGGLRREQEIPADAHILGSIGRLEPIKDYHTMIEAFRHLVDRGRLDATPFLIIAGDGSDREALARRVAECGLAEHVRLLGWRNDTNDLLAAFSLFTMSSVSEGTSVSLLEAMSSGLCPVVTDVGGNREVLGPRLPHRLVPSNDPVALATAWEQALLDPATRKADGVIARTRVKESYSITKMVRQYERLYASRTNESLSA